METSKPMKIAKKRKYRQNRTQKIGAPKIFLKLSILPSETYYLSTLGNLFTILKNWEIFSLC